MTEKKVMIYVAEACLVQGVNPLNYLCILLMVEGMNGT